MLQKLPVLHWIVKAVETKNKTHKRPGLFIWVLTDKQNHRINVLGVKEDFLISLDMRPRPRQTKKPVKKVIKKPLGNTKLK